MWNTNEFDLKVADTKLLNQQFGVPNIFRKKVYMHMHIIINNRMRYLESQHTRC